ncbi:MULTISPECIES: RNA polymerase sigma factor [unclassified Paenibacillus]|jgi:RNA polymerase sigma-70 factor (ECF subfamily)|uniref:RNA polymerase sigma factor n=1 Tax=unclassified Paenibacillus TaxID=185978 RepID=UPI0008ABB56B|nr:MULTISPECIES: sigma-70 family RNA polymerase sigma factor [unclassified Paenibacillus]QLG40660.1 sigma-70 family RNA polymerase sigma factor [Paenibacillus sp. E222]SEN62566.1 RNA polymerase sigma-70 factor, ECF subfamily [Paenibacillus sp. OK076]
MANRLQLLLASDFHNLSPQLQEEVYYEYYNMVHGLIVYIIKERAAAEDIIQEAFIKIIKNKPLFDNEVKLKAWLKVVTRNTAINYLRKNKNNRNQLDTDSVFIDMETINQTAASVESTVETQMMQESIEFYLEQLKPEYRVLVELRWKEGLSYREMADLLDTSEEIVKQRLFRARGSIKKKLHKEWGGSIEQRQVR